MLLLLVRHGETAYNAVGRYQGHVQIELNALGQQQATRVCLRLAQRSIQAIYSSDLVRCLQTIQPLIAAVGLPLTLDQRLREIDVGLWEHLTIPEIRASYPGNYAAYKQNPGATVHVGGESYMQLQHRAVAAIQDIIGRHAPTDTVVICAHGGTIRAIACWLLALDVNHYNKMWIDNCALTTLRIEDGHIRLVSLNDNAHAEVSFMATPRDEPLASQGTIA
jgi:broad specificity phosphatase PhoE